MIPNSFAMCFRTDQSGGLFIIGAAETDGLVYTPVLGGANESAYYAVGVEGFSWGNQSLSMCGVCVFKRCVCVCVCV